MRRRWVIGGALLLSALVGAWQVQSRLRREPETVLPDFSEPGPGARAPMSEAFGVRVGRSTLAEVQAWVAARGLRCKDTSARALMAAARAAKLQELDEKRARGEAVDATSGASMLKRKSPMERNPQVRLSCEGTQAAELGDRPRPDALGRLLFVFDSAELPLRHVSYRRMHPGHDEARADLEDALAAMRARFGEATQEQGRVPARGDGARFAQWDPVKREWRYADLVATVSALNFGARGVDVYEAVEVPLPVRSDAPAAALGPSASR